MEWETFERIVSQIMKFPEQVRQISLSNHGEPLCNPLLPQMVKYIKKCGITSRVSIHTNAFQLTGNMLDELAVSNIDRVVISLQGLSDDKYKKMCNVNVNFQLLRDNIEMFYKKQSRTNVFIKIMDTALADENERNLFYKTFEPIADRVFIEKEVPIWKGIEKGNEQVIYNKYGDEFPKQKCCPLIFHTIVIAPNGEIYPCTQLLREDILGNVYDTTLKEVWDGDERKQLLISQCKMTNPKICENCYILQNSIYSKKDMIDDYRNEILSRV